MPNTSGIAKKQISNEMPQNNTSHNNSGNSERSVKSSAASNGSSGGGGRARKRKRCEIEKVNNSDWESELEDCNLEDAIAIERNLRKVAKKNSLSDDEMRRLLQKFVKNEHILALVTLKAEDEIARERREAEQLAIIITGTPSVPKFTRAKARELNQTPSITLPSLADTTQQHDIASLIKDDLHSDDDDEEYTFNDEDFMSDDEHNTTASDMESNPRTPQTPLQQTDMEDSPIKFTEDGCFKIPLDKRKDTQENLLIATRTRSKLCLEQTTIEDIQSEFVPPDVEQSDALDADIAVNDEDWMEFLNDLNDAPNFVGDDDDPINDPEYVAAEKIPVDAEELRDVNISKKELTELVAELFEGLLKEGVSLESIDLETPQKCVHNNANDQRMDAPQILHGISVGNIHNSASAFQQQICVSDATISSTNMTQHDISFHPNVMSTPAGNANANINNGPIVRIVEPSTLIPVACTNSTNSSGKTISIPQSALNSEPELIAVPVPGQPNCYQLAKVIATGDANKENITLTSADNSNEKVEEPFERDPRYTVPYDNNFTWEYISIKKHVYSEYMDKFESLRHIKIVNSAKIDNQPQTSTGLTQHQHDILQQQLRLHVQMLTQSFLQTYSHPDHWKLSAKPKEMLCELQQKATTDASYNAWNLKEAVNLVTKWQEDLSVDTEENREMMSFINSEIDLTNRNTRQIPRFAPRIMDLMLNSNVFMYPQYLPRIPFTPKACSYQSFSPAESQLIAIGLEKHMQRIRQSGERISRKTLPWVVACKRLSKDTVFGKTKRRVFDHIKSLKKAKHYNPVKYFFEHDHAPPTEHNLITFENNTVLPPKERFHDLPIAWQDHLRKQLVPPPKVQAKKVTIPKVSDRARVSYLEVVREALGDDIQLPEHPIEATQPNGSVITESATLTEANESAYNSSNKQRGKSRRKIIPTSVTINVNYMFGSGAAPNNAVGNISGLNCLPDVNYSLDNSILNTTEAIASKAPTNNTSDLQLTAETREKSTALDSIQQKSPAVIAYNYNYGTHTLQPVVELRENRKESAENDVSAIAKALVPDVNASLDNVMNTTDNNFKLLERSQKFHRIHLNKFKKHIKSSSSYFRLSKRNRNVALKRDKRYLQKRCVNLLTTYRLQLEANNELFQHLPLIQHYYCRFYALELYSDLLIDLKMFCRSATATNSTTTTGINVNTNSPSGANKRARNAAITQQQQSLQQADDEVGTAAARSKKANRQEENFRHMLMPDSFEDSNRKDAIYAFNFYEKVEEVLKSSNRPEDCKIFNHILKTFDPKRDKVADLYRKLENLFLPDHTELAQVFLTFLLPTDAAEIGKFFEHFMITNVTTFVNKLNVYFNKQPAQIRKIYACLNELAEDKNITLKKIESKILPLLKGNQFLIDWFMQQFPEVPPPERLLPVPERVNLKEAQNNQTGEFVENVTDFSDIPASEQQQQTQQQGCQLRYINGRIFYGSKITLPAKLSFLAASSYRTLNGDCSDLEAAPPLGCVHGIREHGEKCLAVATATVAASTSLIESTSDDNDKSEEEDVSKVLVIDTTTASEDESIASIETCDDNTLRAHAIRLNPSCYTNATGFPSNTSTPHASTSHHSKKYSLSLNEEGKISPRKHHVPAAAISTNLLTATPQCNSSSAAAQLSTLTTANNVSNNSGTEKRAEKRKLTPTKKIKSPINSIRQPRANLQPMVVIHEPQSSGAISCAKKLKSLIESDGSLTDSKERLQIVARTKQTVLRRTTAADEITIDETDSYNPNIEAKIENSDDMEFLPENSTIPLSLSNTTFPTIKMDLDTDEESVVEVRGGVNSNEQQPTTKMPAPQIDSDEDNKLDIVATLASSDMEPNDSASPSVNTAQTNDAASTAKTRNMRSTTETTSSSSSVATKANAVWSRDEDKIILIEMKLGSRNRCDLYQRIHSKIQKRTLAEIAARHQFLIDFLSKLQGK